MCGIHPTYIVSAFSVVIVRHVPTFDYRCSACFHTEERFLPISRAPLKSDCPGCKGVATLEKQISGGVIADARLRFSSRYPYESYRLSPKTKGCRLNERGNPMIESVAHENRIAKENGMYRD